MTIAQRTQAPTGSNTIAEQYESLIVVRASVVPIGAATFVGAEQTDSPITHRIIIRWLDWLDMQNVVLRDTLRRDNTTRTEVYRIRKIAEDEFGALGDTSTLADPSVVDDLIANRQNRAHA